MISISKKRLLELIQCELELCALENGGVSDWEWCGDSCADFLHENHSDSFEELAKIEMEKEFGETAE